MNRLTVLDGLALVLILVGAINWGVIGLTGLIGPDELNLVVAVLDPIFEPDPQRLVEHFVYLLVGLAGLYYLYPVSRRSVTRRRSR